MKKLSYRYSLVLIALTAAVLIAVQVFFMLKNYEANKARFASEVQQSLNESIEQYFASRARSNIYIMAESTDDSLPENRMRTIVSRIEHADSLMQKDSVQSLILERSSIKRIWSTDTNFRQVEATLDTLRRRPPRRMKLKIDESQIREFEFLTQKLMISISEDLLDLDELNSHFKSELEHQGFDISFRINQEAFGQETSIGDVPKGNFLTTQATSTYLGESHTVGVDFENATLLILKDGITELSISFLLIALVLGTMMHLYRTIHTQKQLAAIKDDLISNITHEFKTPIATIFSALEGVTRFNEDNDPVKTKRYLSMSTDQLHKLNDMVEKLLETATLDQGKLALNREEVELVSLTESVMKRYEVIAGGKTLIFEKQVDQLPVALDQFHIENAISNLIDNAIKYGGSRIIVRLTHKQGRTIWEVEDDGGDIPKVHRERIFEKLYRVPTGNQHDVKGFGIGLYYSRKIAELHEGSLELKVGDGKTTFRLEVA